ncbi:hypothetical protein GCM10020219_090410 [Nonomuraea dietziae]
MTWGRTSLTTFTRRAAASSTSACQKAFGRWLEATPIIPLSRHLPGPPRKRWSSTPHRLAGRVQLPDAVLAEAVVPVGGQVRQLGRDDLALLAERCRSRA